MNTWPDENANGKTLVNPIAITYQGILIVFAREAGRAVDFIYYNVRIPGSPPESTPPWSPLWTAEGAWDAKEWVGWNQLSMTNTTDGADTKPLLRVGGLDLITVPVETLTAGGIDPSAAAEADFQVASDGQYISIFRSTSRHTLFVDRFVLVQQSKAQKDATAASQNTWILQRAWEVRYQRSGQRDVAASDRDTLSSTSMLSRPFLEPTSELAFGEQVQWNQFTVILAPTNSGGWRWHFFYLTEEEGTSIHHVSYPQDATGRVRVNHAAIDRIDLSMMDGNTIHPLPARKGVGPAAVIYHEQERAVTSNGTVTTVRRAARLMVVQPVMEPLNDTVFAFVDFQVSPDGTIAVPEKTPQLVTIDGNLVIDHYEYDSPRDGGFAIPDRAVHDTGDGTFIGAIYWKPWAGARPLLLDGSDGLVRIYYAATGPGSQTGAFEVIQYSPVLTRAILSLPWTATSGPTGSLQLVSQRAGSTMNDLSATLSKVEGRDDLCTLSINYGVDAHLPPETWSGLPRELVAMTAVLNGNAFDDPSAGAVQSLSAPFYDYGGTLQQAALPVGTSKTTAGSITLVTHRPDVPLHSVTVSAGSDSSKVTLAIETAPDATMTFRQTWTDLNNDVAALVPLLLGDADPSSYPPPAAADTQGYGLATSTGTILLFAAAKTAKVSITIVAAASKNTNDCDVRVAINGGDERVQPDVSRAQKDVIEAIRANAPDGSFAWISPDPAAGTVIDQSIAGTLRLSDLSVLFDVVPTKATGGLVPSATPVPAMVVQGHAPTAPAARQLFALTAVPLATPIFGAVATIDLVPVVPRNPGGNGMILVPANRPQAASFLGTELVAVDVTTAAALALEPLRSWTIEAWCSPDVGRAAGAVVNYSLGGDARPDGIVPAYYLSMRPWRALEMSAGASGPAVELEGNTAFDDAHTAGTWEVWVAPSSFADGPNVVVENFDTFNDGALSAMFVESDGTPKFTRMLADGSVLTVSGSAGQVPLDAWTHLAVTWEELGTGIHRFTLFVNAVQAGTGDGGPLKSYLNPNGPTPLLGTFGGTPPPGRGEAKVLSGAFSQLRFWNVARHAADLEAFLYANPDYGVVPPDCVGWWPLDDPIAQQSSKVRSVTQLPPGTVMITDGSVSVSWSSPLVFPVGAAGGSPLVRGNGPQGLLLKTGEWNHAAAIYQPLGVLELNLGAAAPDAGTLAYAWCRGSGLAPANGTVEAWVTTGATTGQSQTIVSVYGATAADQSYSLGVDATGQISFSAGYTSSDKTYAVSVTAPRPSAGLHYVAATWQTETTAGSSSADPATTTLTVALTIDQLDPVTASSPAVSDIQPITSGAAFCIGICALGETPQVQDPAANQYFSGGVSGVRVWSQALDRDAIQAARSIQKAYDGEPGVISAWWFEELGGLAAADSVGDNHLTLSQDGIWAINTDLASTTLCVNGVRVPSIAVAPGSGPDYPSRIAQFSIGGSQSASGEPADGFGGGIAEVRVWSTALSPDQILDNMYRPLTAGTPELAGYWPLSDDLDDASGQGNGGDPVGGTPSVNPSGPPIGNEAPEVWNPWNVWNYGDAATNSFQQRLQGTPAVVEFGDTIVAADGSPGAALRRAAFWQSTDPSDVLPVLDTSYTVGELDLVYIGQVQTDPTLTGFIEGAPPVPSENLSRPLYASTYGYNAYANASSVTLTQPESTSLTFADQHSRSIMSTVEIEGGPIMKGETDLGGLGIEEEIEEYEVKLGIKDTEAGTSTTQSNDSNNAAWSKTFTETMGLRGAWEPRQPLTNDYLNPVVGRRYQPSNLGYALVESLTADLYCMQMRGSGVMVGRVLVPDPDIPPDKNIIIFPIDPRYIKNGTLDGKVGLVNDPDYPDADVRRGSYFKPREAYALKKQIEQALAKTQAYYDQFDAVGQSSAKAALAGPGSESDYDAGSSVPSSLLPSTSMVGENGLVNTYVWSAYGGLYTEEQQFTAVQTRSFSGFLSLQVMGGITVDAEAATPVGGTFASVDALLGGQFQVQVSKADSETQGLTLSVSVAGEPVMQAYIPDSKDTYPQYSASPAPGKVDAYRFMAFYLPSDGDNGTTFRDLVVDKNWLSNSSDPNAIALRSVDFDHCSPWRVLYRVTYVSRIPPPFNTNPSQSVGPSPAQIIATEDDLLLIDMLQANLDGGAPPTPENVGNALQAALGITTPAAGRPSLTPVLPWWKAFVDYAAANPQSAQGLALLQIKRNAYDYVMNGYASKLLPLPDGTTATARARSTNVRLPIPRSKTTAAPRATQRGVQRLRAR